MSEAQHTVVDGMAKPEPADLSQTLVRLHRLHTQNAPERIFGILERLFTSRSLVPEGPAQAYTILRAASSIGFAPFHAAGGEAFEAGLLDALDPGDADVAALLRRYEMGRQRAERRRYVPVVSLGMGCLPWLLCARWYMRPPRRLRRLYGPLDLAAQHFDTLRWLSEGDFRQLFDPTAYRIVTTDRGQPLPYNIPAKIYFNHNRAPRWHNNDFRLLIRALEQRVSNLRAALSSDDVLFFHVSNKIKTAAHAEAMLGALVQAGGPLSCLPERNLLIVSIDAALTPGSEEVSPRCRFLRMPVPRESYFWPDATSYGTEEGYAFETGLVDAIDAFWREIRPRRARPAAVAETAGAA